MEIVETSVFTKRCEKHFSAEEYRQLQLYLVNRPDAGVVIPSGGGIRKLRWSASGRGKRGGARLIYYWATQSDQVLMLFLFLKNERDNLTASQLKTMRQYVETHYP